MLKEQAFIKKFKSRFSGKIDKNKELCVGPKPEHPFVIEKDGREIGCAYLHFDIGIRPLMVWLMYIKVYKRCEGYGTQIMNQLCQLADEMGVRLYLEPVPDKGVPYSRSELVGWYMRFGFTGDVVMEREPNA